MGKSTYHHGDLRQALLAAAERLVLREGAAQVSLRGIAREAGVSPAAPYHHFPDREALLAGVAASGFESLREAMERVASGHRRDDPLLRLQAAGIAYVRFAVDNPEIYRLMFGGIVADRSRFPELQAAADSAFGLLLDLLGPRARTGEAGGLPAVALATWSTVHGLAFLLIEGLLDEKSAGLETEEIAREVTLALGRGLGAYTSGGRFVDGTETRPAAR